MVQYGIAEFHDQISIENAPITKTTTTITAIATAKKSVRVDKHVQIVIHI